MRSDGASVCNAAQRTMRLDVATKMAFTRQCAWVCWADGQKMERNAMRHILDDVHFESASADKPWPSPCELILKGSRLESGRSYACKACIHVAGTEHCADNRNAPITVQTPSNISAVSIVTVSGGSDVFAMTDFVGFNVTETTFDVATTNFTVFLDYGSPQQMAMATGRIDEIESRSVVFTEVGEGADSFVQTTICGLDADSCSACFDKHVIVLRNEQLNDAVALCAAFANIRAVVMAGGNKMAMFRSARLILDFLDDEELYCRDECLRSTFNDSFHTTLALIDADSFNSDVVSIATQTIRQFLTPPQCSDDADATVQLEILQQTVDILSQHVVSEEEAQNVLDVAIQMLDVDVTEHELEDGESDDGDVKDELSQSLCASVMFGMKIAESMLGQVTAAQSGTDTASTALSGDLICGVGVRACPNCELATGSACVPDLRVAAQESTASTTQRQLIVVAVDADYARPCVERAFTQRTSISVTDPEHEGAVISRQLLNITFTNDDGLADGEELEVTLLPSAILDAEALDANGCALGEIIVLALNETTGQYSAEGITVHSRENGTSFSTRHNSVFVAARKMKRGLTGNALGNLIVSLVAVVAFAALCVHVVVDVVKSKELKGTARQMRIFIALVCSSHIIGESASIAYYVRALRNPCPFEGGSLLNDLMALAVVLPMTQHFWSASLCVMAWLSVFWKSTMQRSAKQIRRFGHQLIAINVVFSTLMLGVAVSVAIFDEEETVRLVLLTAAIVTTSLNSGVALRMFFASRNLLEHVKAVTRAVGRKTDNAVIRKLRVSGKLIPLCLGAYSVAIFVSAYDEAFYLRYDAYLNLVVKLSHVVGFVTINYVFSGGNKKTAKTDASAKKGRAPKQARTGVATKTKKKRRSKEVNIEIVEEKAVLKKKKRNEKKRKRKEMGECAQCKQFQQLAGGEWDGDDWYCRGCCAQYQQQVTESAEEPEESEEEYEDWTEEEYA